MKNTYQIGKWKYEIEDRELAQGKTAFYARVYNMNTKSVWNALKYNYVFRTAEERNEWVRKFIESQEKWEETKKERQQARKSEETLTSIVKKALAAKYGFKNVKVKNGTGTAWGWVNASVTVNETKPSCEFCPSSTWGTCYTCREKMNQKRLEAERIAYEALAQAGKKFYTYYSDDGYGTERSEFSLDINYVQ